MSDTATLLEPISADQPAGANLYYAPEFDAIKEARRQEDTGPRGIWEREIKTADYRLVAKLCEDALTNKTKDLWIASWLAEAWIYLNGTAGLLTGVQFLHSFLEKFWDDLYPAKDDLESRAAPLEWFGSYFDPSKSSSPKTAVCRLRIVKDNYDYFAYQESRKIGYEADAAGEKAKKKRAELIAEGKLTAEAFDKAFEETPKAFYRKLESDLKPALEALNQLDTFCRERFKDAAPSFLALRNAVGDITNAVHLLLERKLRTDPDPVVEDKPPEISLVETAVLPQPLAAQAADLIQVSGGSIASADQAILHVLAAAQFLRGSNPSSPLSYLLLRALRWGEVRTSSEINSSELAAPSGEIRVKLRNAAGAHNWREVLEIAETAMSSLTGRGWLDLQRYSVKACDELGYTAAAKALRSELKCFLADFPQLPKAILNDDTGAANPETLAWLEKEGLLPAPK